MRLFLTGLTAASLAVACTPLQVQQTETAISTALVSDADEVALGTKIHEQLEHGGEGQAPIKYVTDPQVVSYVEGLVNKLAVFAKKDRSSDFHMHVINDPKTVNAFATPGGHLYVYTGLLLSSDNEAELVGVLGHEMGHVVAHHAARTLVETFGMQTVLGLAVGKDPTMLAQVAGGVAGLAGQGVLLAHSRSDENEADGYAVKYAAEAGYDPHGIASFFQKLLKLQGNTPRLLTWLQTHPATADRIAHVDAVIARDGLKGTDLGAERLAPIKQRLSASAPVSMR